MEAKKCERGLFDLFVVYVLPTLNAGLLFGGGAIGLALLLLWPQLTGADAPSVALQVAPQGLGVQGHF